MAHIVEHLPVEELERLYRAARDATEARHIQAIWLLAQGRTVLDVASVLAFVPRWVEGLAARYNAHGPAALGDQRRRNGRAASVLTPALLAALSERLRAPPRTAGAGPAPRSRCGWRAVSGWSGCTRSAAGKALRRVRWSIQAPPPRHPRAATLGQQAAFRRGSTRRSRAPRRHTPTGRSRSGPRTSTASA